MACGRCELQGVGRQVWLCLTRVGSGRNLAQRGPKWLGERDLRACGSPQPFPGGARTARTASEDIRPATQTVAAQVRVPASQAPSFSYSYGFRWLTMAERSIWEVCWVLGPAPERRIGVRWGGGGGVQLRMPERPRADAGAEQRRAHPQTAPQN